LSESSAEATNEFSRLVTPDRLSGQQLTEAIEALPGECAALARRLGILAVDRLTARLTVKNLSGRVFRVEGTWEAAVQQACVVTLEPVAESLSGCVEASFEAGARRPADHGGEVLVDPEAADPADVLPEDGIDLGELVVQELAVALDPYPRAPGAAVPPQYQPSEVEKNEGPFAALKVLKGER
jgi:uncharacterized metal-binding protein YceD (DUF177 family)